MIFRRWSDSVYRNFDYHSRDLPGQNVQLVGPDASSVVVSN